MQQQVAPPAQSTPSGRSKAATLFLGAGSNILLALLAGWSCSRLFPPFEIWWLAWFGLSPLLLALRRTATIRAAGWLMLVFSICFAACTMPWMRTIFGNSAPGIYVLAFLPWVLFALAYRWLTSRTAYWDSRWWAGICIILLAPVLFLAADWLRCEGWYLQFSWMQFGFVFSSCRHMDLLYPYIGVYGATFLIVLSNAVLAEILLTRARFHRKALGVVLLAFPVLILTLSLNSKASMPIYRNGSDRAIRVGIVQHESGNLTALKHQTRLLAREHPALIVWPEYAVPDYPLEKPHLLAELQEIARSAGCTLVLGCKKHAPPDSRVDWLRRRGMMAMEGALFGNIALIIGPEGKIIGEYQKTHPIPLFSDGIPGTAYPTFPSSAGRLGVGICYDFDFASSSWRLVRNGAELLIIPTYDSQDWGMVQHMQHARMAQARSAETARWTIRATSSGVSQIISPAGQVTTCLDDGVTASAAGLVHPCRQITPYARYGYLLPFACMAISLLWGIGMSVLAVWEVYKRRKGRTPAIM